MNTLSRFTTTEIRPDIYISLRGLIISTLIAENRGVNEIAEIGTRDSRSAGEWGRIIYNDIESSGGDRETGVCKFPSILSTTTNLSPQLGNRPSLPEPYVTLI